METSLVNLLKSKNDSDTIQKSDRILKKQLSENIIYRNQNTDDQKNSDKTPTNSELGFVLSESDLEKIKASVNDTFDVTDKSRKEIIIGKYGNIKNPNNNKRFSIPTLSWDTEDYTYEYAKYMRMLVKNPEQFTKVMNWE